MSPTRFGVLARKDPAFVFQLRAGRKVREATAVAVQIWMDEYKRRHEGQSSKPAPAPASPRVLVVQPTASAPASLHFCGRGKPRVVPLTPHRALELAGDLMQAAASGLTPTGDEAGGGQP